MLVQLQEDEGKVNLKEASLKSYESLTSHLSSSSPVSFDRAPTLKGLFGLGGGCSQERNEGLSTKLPLWIWMSGTIP